MQAFNRTLQGPNVYRDWQACWSNVEGDLDAALPIAENEIADMQVRRPRSPSFVLLLIQKMVQTNLEYFHFAPCMRPVPTCRCAADS